MIHVLDAGVDTLYWSAAPNVGSWYDAAIAARNTAAQARRPMPWARCMRLLV